MKKGINPSLIFLYLSYALLLFQAMFNTVSIFIPFFSLIDKFIVVFIMIAILLQNSIYRVKEILLVFIIFIIGITPYTITRDNIILKACLLIIASKDIDFKKFIKFDFIIKLIYISTVIIFSKYGLAENHIIMRSDGTIRQSLGFSHPNALAAYWLSICCSYFYLFFNKNKIMKIIICSIITFFIGNITDSRTVIICVYLMMGILICKYYLKFKFHHRIIRKTIILLPFILFLLSLSTAYLYNSSNIVQDLDKLLSKRIYYTEQFINEYEVNFFGQKLQTISTVESKILNVPPKILDNSYITLLLKFGIISLVGICVLFSLRLKVSYHQNDKILIIILIIFLISGIFEAWLIKINYNPFLLSFSSLIYSHKKNKAGEILLRI